MGERAAPPARLSGAVALLVSLAPLLAAGQQGRPPEQLRADLERLRSQISTLETQLAQIGEQRETLNDDFEAADIELVLGRQRLQVIRIRLSVLAEEAVERQRQVDRLSAELDDARQELAARIVALYRMGPLSYSRFLLAADSPEEVLANYQMVGRLAAQDRSLVTSIRISLERHREAVRLLSTSRARLATMRDEEGLAVANLGARQELRRELIRQLDIEAAYGRQALAEREDSAVALERLLGSVSASSTVAAPVAGEAGFATTRGELSWPAEGPVTETFGRKRHPVYDTYTLQKGIEIDAGAGAAVQAEVRGLVPELRPGCDPRPRRRLLHDLRPPGEHRGAAGRLGGPRQPARHGRGDRLARGPQPLLRDSRGHRGSQPAELAEAALAGLARPRDPLRRSG